MSEFDLCAWTGTIPELGNVGSLSFDVLSPLAAAVLLTMLQENYQQVNQVHLRIKPTFLCKLSTLVNQTLPFQTLFTRRRRAITQTIT